MKMEFSIFDFWKERFLRFIETNEEWDFENYIPLDDCRPTLPDLIKKSKSFSKKLGKLLKDYGVDCEHSILEHDSPFYMEFTPFGPDWTSSDGVVSKLRDAYKCNDQHLQQLEDQFSKLKKIKTPPGPKKKLYPKTAKAILVGIYMLKMERQDCTPMRRFLEPKGEFEKLAKDHNTTIEAFGRRQDSFESIQRWTESAQDRCIEAILSRKSNTTVKISLKNKKAKQDLRSSAKATADRLIAQFKIQHIT